MQTDQQSTLNSLQDKPPEAWLKYLCDVEQGRLSKSLSMEAIFHFAAPRAKDQLDLIWAEVAVRAAKLEASGSSGVELENALAREMGLRSWFIARMGAHSNNIVLDKDSVLQWILDGFQISLSVAKEKAASLWKDMARARNSSNPDDLRESTRDLVLLRNINRRLHVAKALAESGQLENEPVITEWLGIREQLP